MSFGVKQFIGSLIFLSMVCGCGLNNPKDAVSDWNLVWFDEFDYEGLPDQSKWAYDEGWGCDKPCGCGWGNAELQTYTEGKERNARVLNGHLIIEAHRTTEGEPQYSSARLISKPQGQWTYGRVECRAQLPAARGTWPAIWMLPVENHYGGWPASGEIDIMEHVGYALDSVFGTIHTTAFNHLNGTQRGGNIFVPGLSESFHVFSMEWSPNALVWFVDDQEFFRFDREEGSEKWPFDQPFYLLTNLAVGGHWGGKHGVDEAAFPQRFLIDYVRVYQKDSYDIP